VAGQVPPPNEGVLQYPIYDERAAWERNAYRLKGLHQHHREMLLIMQPFNSDPDANYLGWLNRLARVDRHRTLVTGAARLAQVEPVLQVPDGSADVSARLEEDSGQDRQTEEETMVDFRFDKKGFADLEKHIGQELKTVEAEANRAAARESTPEGKARAFARVLRKHGVENVNEAELRRKFGG
jgi:hypothetical protein